MFRTTLFAFACSVATLGTCSAAGQELLNIGWKDLVPPKVEDPFQKLSQQQVQELAYIARIRNLITAEKIHVDGPTAREAAQAERRLNEAGVDVSYFLSIREQVRRLREIQASAVQTDLQGKVVRLAGFVVPLKTSDDLVTEFLLVPMADSCSDAQLPQPNQAVFVRSTDGIASQGRQSAVRVTGQIETKQTSCLMQRKLGVAHVTAAYALAPQAIEIYRDAVANE